MTGALLQIVMGAAFGAVLASNGAADFDAMERMFLLEEAHLYGVAAISAASSAAGLAWLARSSSASDIRWPRRPIQRGSVMGGLIFGVGWGLSGTCPGTALVQLGGGHLIAALTIAGILLGNWLYLRLPLERWGVRQSGC